ncbi:hypothetical protein [uncultured Nostoc sp.]
MIMRIGGHSVCLPTFSLLRVRSPSNFLKECQGLQCDRNSV